MPRVAKKKILIVDDDAELCAELASVLEQSGFALETVHDGFDAERLLKKKKFDLLLVDYKMARMDGIEVIKRARAMGCQAKILMVTGGPYAEKLIREAGVAEETSGMILKPFDIDLLLRRIRELI